MSSSPRLTGTRYWWWTMCTMYIVHNTHLPGIGLDILVLGYELVWYIHICTVIVVKQRPNDFQDILLEWRPETGQWAWFHNEWHAALDVGADHHRVGLPSTVEVLPGQHLPAWLSPWRALPLPDRHSNQPSHIGGCHLGRATSAQTLQKIFYRKWWKWSTFLLALPSSNVTAASTPVCRYCQSTSAHSRSPPRPLWGSHPLADNFSFVLDCCRTTHQGRTNPSAAYFSAPRPWPRSSHILDSRLHASELPTRRCDNRTLVARRSDVNTGQGWPLPLLCQVLFFSKIH